MCAKSLQSCPILCDPIDCSLPGSSVHGIFQARILEWVAVCPPPGDLPYPGIEPASFTSPALAGWQNIHRMVCMRAAECYLNMDSCISDMVVPGAQEKTRKPKLFIFGYLRNLSFETLWVISSRKAFLDHCGELRCLSFIASRISWLCHNQISIYFYSYCLESR